MIIAIIQARMGSTRLPGKVMLDLCGHPVIWHVVQRVSRSKNITHVVVATSIDKANDSIRKYCNDNQVDIYSGSETDVLDRFLKAAIFEHANPDDLIVRITADCPLIDHKIIDQVIESHQKSDADYTSNVINPTFPDGLDCEIFSFSTLIKANEFANLKSDREHVTLCMRNNPQLFRLNSVCHDIDLSALRWTLDTNQDYEFIKSVYQKLYFANIDFNMPDILELLIQYPDLAKMNSMFERNEGLIKSLNEDGASIE